MGSTRTPPVFLNTGAGQPPNNKTITTVSTEILAANSNRVWCFLTNDGFQDVWIAVGHPAVVGKGIFLAKNGGKEKIDLNAHNNEAINGIVAADTSTVALQEAI
ncbi:MAG: hypothetical protein JKY53_15010 [Flavobacteriales bacterium]|nr:hypothetical protein [Flavobacteriales bacterium]